LESDTAKTGDQIRNQSLVESLGSGSHPCSLSLPAERICSLKLRGDGKNHQEKKDKCPKVPTLVPGNGTHQKPPTWENHVGGCWSCFSSL